MTTIFNRPELRARIADVHNRTILSSDLRFNLARQFLGDFTMASLPRNAMRASLTAELASS